MHPDAQKLGAQIHALEVELVTLLARAAQLVLFTAGELGFANPLFAR